MEWINVKERLPEIEELEPGCVAGRSDPVLVYCEGFVNDTPVSLYPFAVAALFKGGRGDLTSLHWDCDFEPTHWKRLDAPKESSTDDQLTRAYELHKLVNWAISEGVQVAQYGSWFGTYTGDVRPPGCEGCISYEQTFMTALRKAKANIVE